MYALVVWTFFGRQLEFEILEHLSYAIFSTPEICKELEQQRKDLSPALIANCNRKAKVGKCLDIK